MRLGAPCVLCTVSVPGPIVGAGISGLVAACIGMLGRDTALEAHDTAPPLDQGQRSCHCRCARRAWSHR